MNSMIGFYYYFSGEKCGVQLELFESMKNGKRNVHKPPTIFDDF